MKTFQTMFEDLMVQAAFAEAGEYRLLRDHLQLRPDNGLRMLMTENRA